MQKKVAFISSVIKGMEEFREAAARGARALDMGVKRSEDFRASPDSSQVACLSGVREADVVLLLLGARYGYRQKKSGLSATHEEYREAKARGRDILVFIQRGIDREPDQEAFLREVQDWAAGVCTETFSIPEELQAAVTRGLHTLLLSRARGGADVEEMMTRARQLLPDRRGGFGPTLGLVVVGGPRQTILQPARLDDQKLQRRLLDDALSGAAAILDRAEGTRARRQSNAVLLEQEHSSFLVDSLGSVRLLQPASGDRPRGDLPILIYEDIRDRISRGLRCIAKILDRIDSTRRLSDLVVLAALFDIGYLGWRTRREHAANPSSVPMSMRVRPDPLIVALDPPSLKRPALTVDRKQLAEDLAVLLREEVAE